VDLSLFSNHTYRLAKLAAFVFAIAFTAMFFNFVFFLTQRWGYTLFQAGLAITPGPLVVIPVAIVAGRIADRRGHRAVLVAGGLVFAFGGALLYSAVESPPDFVRTWLPRALVTGTGVGLVLPALSGAAVHGLPPGRLAVGSAINQAVRQLGSVIGVGLVIALLGRAGRFPKQHWKNIRTTNVIERLNGEFRRRVKTQGSLPSEGAALVLLFGLIATGQIRLRKIDGYKKLAGLISEQMRRAA